MISLSSIFQMRHGLLKKRKKRERKDGMPKKHDPKKIGAHEGPSVKKNWTHEGPRKKRIYSGIYTCPHVIQIKGIEIHKRSTPFPPSTFYTRAQS